MGVYLEIIFTVLGGLIAGVVGLSSTYISLKAHRREKHFEEHKENLRLLESALRQGQSQLWPFTNGAESIKLSPKYEITPALDTGINFIISTLVTKYSDNTMYSVDRVLYKDIKNHFHNLWRMFSISFMQSSMSENNFSLIPSISFISSFISLFTASPIFLRVLYNPIFFKILILFGQLLSSSFTANKKTYPATEHW